MPLWPFGRKKRRTSTSFSSFSATSSGPATATAGAPGASGVPVAVVSDGPAQATTHAPNDMSGKEEVDRRGSVQADLTALPALSELEASPHLRPANAIKPVHPYNLDRPSSSGRAHAAAVSNPGYSSDNPTAPAHHNTPRKTAPARRPSNKRKKDQALREEEIRQMSAPMQIPKRPAGSANDLLRRDSKKARRTLTKRNDDPRSSTISLPLQSSFYSPMSAVAEQRGWEIGGISILSPRPTVRLSGTGFHTTPHVNEKRPPKMEKLPELARSSSKKDGRKVADLADELDSSELRILLERDQRRKERKAMEQHDRLDRKLRKRADKQRQEDERRARETREARQRATPPTAIHPAFREQQPEAELTTPVSLKKQGKQPASEEEMGSSKGGTYLRYPPGEDIPQNPFVDPENPFTAPGAEYSPVQTPLDEPVLETARAIRLSGHFSPPASPVQNVHPSPSLPEVSNLKRERTSSIPAPATSFESSRRRQSESSSRRGPGTWASIFRRGISSTRVSEDKPDRSSPSEFSFVNTSRESMARQPIPAHLVQQPSIRQSGTPHRTQSKFREDLPELPISPPASRVQSPELPLIATNVAAARRAKRAANRKESGITSSGVSPAIPIAQRTDSPTVGEDQESMALSQSYGSVDSEGSWISGRPIKRGSAPSHHGSFAKPKDDFTASFDRLPVPEHEYFAALNTDTGSRRASGEQTVDVTPTANLTPNDIADLSPDITPLRQATARRRPTVVHNDPRFKSREGLLTEYNAAEVVMSSREGSINSSDSAENSPVELRRAQSVSYGRSLGHVKSLSAGSARLLDIGSPKRSNSVSPNLSPGASPRVLQE